MSTVQILPAPAPTVHQTSSWPLISSIFSAFSRAHYSTPTKVPVVNVEEEPKELFPDLPPLLHGHPDVHMREGVMNASRAAASGVPDAEKAFFVADLSRVYQQHLRWQHCLPGVEPFYAVKCNPDPYVLRLLAALGTGFDCASNGEIASVLGIGPSAIDASRIIFANPCKATSFIRSAARAGVDLMTFDNTDELYKVARAHRGAKLVLRILTDDSKALCRLGLKFGAPLATVPALLAKAKELALDVVGVSFHVGSGCYDTDAFADAVRRARAAFDMGTEAGYTFSLLDVGGGFEDATFEATASVLMRALDEYFPDRARTTTAAANINTTGGCGAGWAMGMGGGVRVIAEPGRFYVSQAFRLAANVIARRAPAEDDRDDGDDDGDRGCGEVVEEKNTKKKEGGVFVPAGEGDGDSPRVMYYINDGVYGAFNCILFDHQTVQPYVLSMGGSFHVPATAPQQACSVWGPTCDSIDCVCPTTRLPRALRVGDWLAFDNMGAYTVCAASQFNGFEVSNVIYTTGNTHAAEVCAALTAFATASAAAQGGGVGAGHGA